jgi:pyruvate dehydrogenase E1 component alpha subunit
VDRALSQQERLYRTILLIRRFEERALDLSRSGEIVGGIHPYIGQEAVAAGVVETLGPDDVVLSNHRGHGHALAKGSDPRRLLAELTGRVTGVGRGRGGSLHTSDFPVGVYGATITVGHGAAMGTGVAWALAQDRPGHVVVSFFGDGAMNQGALLESFNLAALWRVPQIFVCEDNGYATTQRADATTAGTFTARAEAIGVPALTVDGMDPVAVLDAAAGAVARARAGEGPTLLVAETYRFGPHHTFEFVARPRYRAAEEVEAWRARDPLARQAARVPDERRHEIDAEVEALIEEATRFAVESPKPDPADALDHHYASGLRVRAGVA